MLDLVAEVGVVVEELLLTHALYSVFHVLELLLSGLHISKDLSGDVEEDVLVMGQELGELEAVDGIEHDVNFIYLLEDKNLLIIES